MSRSSGRWFGWLVLPAVLLSLVGWAVAGEGRPRPKGKAEKAVQEEAKAENQYWIGIAAMPADTLLKTHLKIDAGVVVQRVVADSPAANAGIKEDDLVLKFGDTKASDALELSKAVNANQDRPVKVTLLREGQETVVEVTPVRRPAGMEPQFWPETGGEAAKHVEEMLKGWEEWGQKGHAGTPPKVFFFRPGLTMPEGWKGGRFPRFTTKLFLNMPKDTSVTISKVDDGPAKVLVKQGDKSWEVKEDELDKLPDEVRQIVQGVLNNGLPFRLSFDVAEEGAKSAAEAEAKAEAGDAATGAKKEVDSALKKLEGVRRDMQENQKRLQQELEKLRQQMDDLKKPRK